MEARSIALYRKTLNDQFCDNGEVAGLVLHPTIRDAREIELTGRLYEETFGSREIIIFYGEDIVRSPDAFLKKTGDNLDVDLLGIAVKPDNEIIGLLWEAYVLWMHRGVSGEEILSKLEQSAAAP